MIASECLLETCEPVTGFPWLGLLVVAVVVPVLWLAYKWDRDYDRKEDK